MNLRFLQSFTFRLALVYVGLFSLSVVLLFVFIYKFATRYVEQQIVDDIQLQYSRLYDEYQTLGTRGVEERIAQMVENDEEGTEIYLLINAEGERLAGNLEAWPKYDVSESKFGNYGEWIRFSIEGTRTYPRPIRVKAITMPLSKYRRLLVGQSMLAKQKIEQTISQAFWASLLVTVAMAFIGAFVITNSVGRRINIINRSAHDIMHGNLSARIPRTHVGDQFDILSANLNQMLDKIEALLKSLSDFANNIAHDLRTPLNRIVARTEAGMRGLKENSAARRLFETSIQDMEELIATFNSILKISELESNADIGTFEPCDMRLLIERLVELYEPYASEKNVKLQNVIPDGLTIRGEKNLLTQAFANLIDNAIKFSPEEGEVRITGESSDDRIILSVADNGPGIPPEYHHKVFEKFFRIEASRSAGGNGLGLSLVAAIARIHGATVKLESNNPGLKVILTF